MRPGRDRPAGPERRSHPRQMAVLRVAKLVSERGEQLCRIRNISSGGAMAVTACAYEPEERVMLELKSGWSAPARIVWVEGSLIGLAFDVPIDPLAVLAADTSSGDGPRSPRVRIEAGALVRLGSEYRSTLAHDISLGGIKVALSEPACVGDETVVTLEGLPALAGVVRWQRDGFAGIVFNEPLGIDHLSAWLAIRRTDRGA